MDAYALEPELQRSPRKVRRRGTHGFGTVFSQWVIMPPLIALTLFIMAWGAHLVIVRASGPIVRCKITERYRKDDGEDHKTLNHLSYRYEVAGKPFVGHEVVEEDVYRQVKNQSAMQVQVSPIFPGRDSLLLTPGRNIWGEVWTVGIASVLMVAGLLAVGWYLYIVPSKGAKLISHGLPVRGVLMDKKQIIGYKSVWNDLYYEYQPGGSEDMCAGCQSVRKSDWDTATVGEAYTVLYDPQNPQQSVLYQYADYRAV